MNIRKPICAFLSAAICLSPLALCAQAKTVRKYVKSINVKSEAEIILPVDKKSVTKTLAVKVKVKGKASKKFTAKTDKKSVATVKVQGNSVKITAKKAGNAKITLTSKALGLNGKRLKKTVRIKVRVDYSAKYKRIVTAKMKELDFQGVVRISKDGEVVCELANGTLTPDSSEPIKTDSQFALGSASKQFTAAAIMLLKQEGKIRVDDTIDKWFPEYQYAKDITVKNLLTMRSGIRDYVNSPESEKEYYSRYNYGSDATGYENREATRKWIFKKQLEFKPGTEAAYSNSNYFLLAEIAEKVSGTDFATFLKDNFFIPLKMKDTDTGSLLTDYSRLVPPIVDKYPAEIYAKGIAFGDGGLVSTGADIDKWLTSLRKNTILSKASVKEMTTNYSPGEYPYYGYGFMIKTEGIWEHEGAIDSYLTHVATVPGKKYNLYISTNRDDYKKLSEFAAFVRENTL